MHQRSDFPRVSWSTHRPSSEMVLASIGGLSRCFRFWAFFTDIRNDHSFHHRLYHHQGSRVWTTIYLPCVACTSKYGIGFQSPTMWKYWRKILAPNSLVSPINCLAEFKKPFAIPAKLKKEGFLWWDQARRIHVPVPHIFMLHMQLVGRFPSPPQPGNRNGLPSPVSWHTVSLLR